MTRYRLIGLGHGGQVLDLPDGLDRWRIPRTERLHIWDYDDAIDCGPEYDEWTLRRWRGEWHRIGDDCEYATAPGCELVWAAISVSESMLMSGGWAALALVGDEMLRSLPGVLVGSPLMWGEYNMLSATLAVRMSAVSFLG